MSRNTCPGYFEWSAFGATYMDTACQDGECADLDNDWARNAGIPCPFCNPLGFFDYQFGGAWIEPTCIVCLTRLPPESVTFVDGYQLTWTVDCTTCGTTEQGLMRDYEPEDGKVE